MNTGKSTRVIACLVVFGVLTSCSIADDRMCNIEVMADRRSPNGHWRAVAFTRNCSALSAEMTSVSILPAAVDLPNEYGNVFRYIDTTSVGPNISRAATLKPLLVEWTADGRLIAKFDRRAEVNHRVTLYNTIPVDYREY